MEFSLARDSEKTVGYCWFYFGKCQVTRIKLKKLESDEVEQDGDVSLSGC